MAMDICALKKSFNLITDFFKDGFSFRALYLSETVPVFVCAVALCCVQTINDSSSEPLVGGRTVFHLWFD